MPYSAGTATDIADLASKLEAWLTGLSSPWTVDRSDAAGTGRRLQVHKGSTFASLRFANNENPNTQLGETVYAMAVSPHSSYSAGSDWYNQTGAPLCANGTQTLGYHAKCLSANIPYHFFADSGCDNIVVVLQFATGVWNYVGWGASLTKFGAWTGGRWAIGAQSSASVELGSDGSILPPPPPSSYVSGQSATRGRAVVRVDADGFGEEWRNTVLPTAATTERTTRVITGFGLIRGQNVGSSLWGHLWTRTRSQLAQGVIVLPSILRLHHSAGVYTGLYSPLGAIPLVVECFTRNQVADGAQFTVGVKNYRAFGSYAVEEV